MNYTDPKNSAHRGEPLDSKDGLSVVACETCGFKHVTPLPTAADLAKLYEHEFYTETKPHYFAHVEEDLPWWNMHFDNRFSLFEKHTSQRKLLDIGSGPGYFLKRGKERGWDVIGFEPSKQAAEYSQKHGVTVVQNFFSQEKALPYGPFDAIHMEMVLEHIPYPYEFLKGAYSLLNPGGIICVVSPNDYNPFQIALRKNHGFEPWWVSPLQHINYFDTQTMQTTLAKVGFDIVDVLATFPIEIFLLMGDNYVGNDELGRACHIKRKRLEHALFKIFENDDMNNFYRSCAKVGVGREFMVLGEKPVLSGRAKAH